MRQDRVGALAASFYSLRVVRVGIARHVHVASMAPRATPSTRCPTQWKHRTILPFEGSHGSTLSGTIATITAATSACLLQVPVHKSRSRESSTHRLNCAQALYHPGRPRARARRRRQGGRGGARVDRGYCSRPQVRRGARVEHLAPRLAGDRKPPGRAALPPKHLEPACSPPA